MLVGGAPEGAGTDGEVDESGGAGSGAGLLTRHYIVGVGASAGGLEALSGLFSSLPTDLGATYVVVQHLSPTYRSMLVQLIGRETAMEVKEVEQHEVPRPDTVYITPPNRNLLFRDGHFELVEPIPNVAPKPSVNSFFYSVAAERGEDVIGVILSGTGSDGAGGVRAIKAGGGLVFAQDPASAKYDGMPQSAIETDCVDWVLTPDAIATIVDHYRSVPAPMTHIVLYSLGGAISRVDPDATAVAHRDARYAAIAIGMWDDRAQDDVNIAWVREFAQRMEPFASSGFYPNYDADAKPDQVQAAFGEAIDL